MLKTIIVAILLLNAVTASALYKCTENGKTIYQPSLCAGSPDAEPLDLKQPPEELQAKMRRQQLERNAEIAKEDLENAKRLTEIERQNYWRIQQQIAVDRENAYQQRMQELADQSRQTQLEIRCSDRHNRSEECQQFRYDKRWNN